MKIIDNTSLLLGDDLKATVGRGTRLKIASNSAFGSGPRIWSNGTVRAMRAL